MKTGEAKHIDTGMPHRANNGGADGGADPAAWAQPHLVEEVAAELLFVGDGEQAGGGGDRGQSRGAARGGGVQAAVPEDVFRLFLGEDLDSI